MTKERIEMVKQALIPFVKKMLLEINYEGLGKSDAEEFEKDLNEILDLSIKALEQQPSDDCVSRQATLNAIIKELCIKDESYLLQSEKAIYNVVKNMPPVTPTHGTCKACKNWDTSWQPNSTNVHFCPMVELNTNPEYYCGDFESRNDNE